MLDDWFSQFLTHIGYPTLYGWWWTLLPSYAKPARQFEAIIPGWLKKSKKQQLKPPTPVNHNQTMGMVVEPITNIYSC